MIDGLDHVGIAVKDIDAAIVLWERVAKAVVEHREVVAEQKVEIATLRIGSLKVELLKPASPDSSVAKFLSARGEGIHHIALKCDSTQEELERAERSGVQLIDRQTRAGMEGTSVGFVHPRALAGVLVEYVSKSNLED